MNKFDTVFNKKDIPSHWEVISRSDSGRQLTVRLGHINPGTYADKLMASGGTHVDENGNAIVVHGISVPVTMTRFFDAMMELAQSGMIPALKPSDILATRTMYNKMRDEKFDLELAVSIGDYGSEAAAEEALENLNPTRTMTISGRNMLDILNDPQIREHMTEEQLKIIAGLPGQLAQVQSDIKSQSGLSYYRDSFLGYPVLVFEKENLIPQKPVKPQTASSQKKRKPAGGGFDSMAIARPKTAPPPEKLINYLGLKVGNYLITGSLLCNIPCCPKGTEYCHSLTKHDEKVEHSTEDGHTYTTTHWLPVASTLAAEGYINREEVTAMIQTIINQLKALN
ncbi:MAG: hypothetical protein WC958_03870 [Dehalococcoidales bacterium]